MELHGCLLNCGRRCFGPVDLWVLPAGGPASLLVPIAAGPPPQIEAGPGQGSPVRPATASSTVGLFLGLRGSLVSFPGHDAPLFARLLSLISGLLTRRQAHNDLAVVCANCHAMIHRHGECRSIHSLIPRGR
jgi:hypothetical protein